MEYEYLCHQCNQEFTATQKMSDEPLSECPLCREEGKDSPPPQKLISLSSFQLKGGGWASEGYK